MRSRMCELDHYALLHASEMMERSVIIKKVDLLVYCYLFNQ
jgi:hypothetical protein